jgi:solute carrier family 25, member 39/40
MFTMSMSISAIAIDSPIDEHYYWDVQDTFSLNDVKDALTKLRFDARLLSGAMGSIVSGCVAQPFEVAKVQQQNYRPSAVAPSHPGVISTLRGVVSREGIRGAYAGLTPTLLMSVPNFVLYLISYDELVGYYRKQSMSPHQQIPEPFVPFVCGATARLIATTAVAPLELLRTRHASSSGSLYQPQASSSRVWNELYSILKNDGFGALYKGLVPSLWRDVPFAAIYMVCLDRFKKSSHPLFYGTTEEVEGTTPLDKKQIGFEFANAALAGMVAASCTAPLDRVKTRLQSVPQGGHTMTAAGQSTREVLRSIVQSEGIQGLWRGNQARMMKVAPQYAIMISCYEVGKKVLA